MGRPGPETMAKRQREQKKAEKRRAKAARKARRKATKNGEPVEPRSVPETGGKLPWED